MKRLLDRFTEFDYLVIIIVVLWGVALLAIALQPEQVMV